jgi:hypothetical protein
VARIVEPPTVQAAFLAGFYRCMATPTAPSWPELSTAATVAPSNVLGAFAAWWSFLCTRALWSEISFRIAIWRLHQAPSMDDWPAARKIKRWEWLSNPKLDRWIDVGTIIGVLCFPVFLWAPIIFWVLK